MKKVLSLWLILSAYSGLKAQDHLVLEDMLAQVQSLTYSIESFDSAYSVTNEMLMLAKTDYEKGLANFARGEVIAKNGWGYYLGEYATPYLEEAVNYFVKAGNSDLLSDALNTLALSYITKYNPNNKLTSARELEYLRMSIKVRIDPDYKIDLPFKANLHDQNTSSEDILPTIEIVKKDLSLARTHNDLNKVMFRTEKLGYLYWQLDKNLSRCESYLLSAAKMATELKNEFFHSICLGELTVYANQAKEYQKALEYGMAGMHHTDANDFGFRATIFLDQLYLSWLALGNENEAVRFKSQSIDLTQNMESITYTTRHKLVMDRIRDMEYRSKLEEELRVKSQRLSLFYFAMFGILCVIGFVFYSNYRLRQKNKEIQEASFLGQSIERKRVAADLHDNLGSTLSSLRWSLDSVDQTTFSEDQRKVFGSLKENLDKAYGDVRLLAHNLLPVALEEVGLCAALQQLTLKLSRNGKTQFKLTCGSDFPKLNKRLEFELYSICLELYSNIIKHARANLSETKLRLENEGVQLIVTDDGKGYQINKAEGMGLKNISERVKAVKGKWTVEQNSDAGGTVNNFQIPVS